MIKNNKCEECNHYFVCKKLAVLEKFDTESKKYIGVDITMDYCKDFESDAAEPSEDEESEGEE